LPGVICRLARTLWRTMTISGSPAARATVDGEKLAPR
jgi:hypothetical protein